MARGKQNEPQKLCLKCGHVLPLSSFYQNREWKAQSCRDAWCKSCTQKFVVNKDTLKQFFWYNNREWSDQSYEQAKKKAAYLLGNDADYVSDKLTEDQKDAMEEKAACKAYLSMMNLEGVYRYAGNQSEVSGYSDYANRDDMKADKDEETLIFSREWNGLYTQREIDYLDDYYAELEEGFVLDNQNIRDYARKAAKASLDADIKYSKMRHGQASVAEWEKAQAIFDNLSKSANFAACKRKPGDMAGLGSLGAIVAKIEMSGELDIPDISFPPDDIDRIIADFRHTVAAVGLEQVVI